MQSQYQQKQSEADQEACPPTTQLPMVFLIGAFPPPVQGMAVINQAMSRHLLSAGRRIRILNMAAPTLSRGIRYHAVRVLRSLCGVATLLLRARSGTHTVYLSISGGYGQLYELVFLFVARVMRLGVTLHHHSYAYLVKRSRLTQILFWAAPTLSAHLALSPGMRARLQEMYGLRNVQVLSNAAFMPEIETEIASDRPLATLGFLSNISAEKGIFEFLQLMDRCRQAGLAVNGLVAGPFQDRHTESAVMRVLRGQDHVRYVGPRYGAEKSEFYRAVDVLIFPTKYANEAEPVTIYEALSHGVPVIASGRGAIPEILEGIHGCVVQTADSFVEVALDRVKGWQADFSIYRRARLRALEYVRTLRRESTQRLRMLVSSI